MPPFSSPVSRIMSVRDAPKYPWRLKSWADLARILSRVSSPLLIYLFLSKALAASLIGANVGKSGSYFSFKTPSKTSHQNVRGIHPNIRFGGQVLDKTVGRKETGDHLAIVKARNAQPFIIPMPGKTQTYYKILFQGLKLKRKREQLMRDAQFAKAGTDLNRDLIGITDALPPIVQRRKGSLTNNFTCGGVSQR